MSTPTIGNVPEGQGKLHSSNDAIIVRKTFSPEHPMQRHNHPGQQIVLTVVHGDAKLLLDDCEEHHLHSGDVLIFDGEYSISGRFAQETLLVITLVKQH